MKIKFINLADELLIPLKRMCTILGLELAEDGIPVEVVKGDTISVSLKNGRGSITYIEKAHFFREVGIFIQHAKEKNEFFVAEKNHFDTVGCMVDASRGGVMTVDAIKRYLDYMAVMGYNMIMMYTEDTYTVPERDYFGYMRGKYSPDELRECDDYANGYGIEMIPCIQLYGHMERYLRWPEASNVKDTDKVLLADEEETYKFIDQMIRAASAPFRSKRIHIGMDEAWDMGRGQYLNRNGYVPRFDIFNRHMARIIEITNKYGLKPMMWSDMYFRIASGKDAYYEAETVVPDEVKEKIPKEVELVFWHYGEKPYCDDYMLKKHMELGRNVIFAGGLWTWIGHLPENNYAFETTEFSIEACKKNGVRQMMTTVWTNDGCECDFFTTLLGLSFTAEMCYGDNTSHEYLAGRFHAATGGNYNAFFDMSAYHNIFDGREYKNFHDRFLGKPLLWQDIMEGLVDCHLYSQPMSGHYKKYKDKMAEYAKCGGAFCELYRYCEALFDLMSTKTYIAERLKPAYDKNDRETLSEIAKIHLPALYEKVRVFHSLHKSLWFKSLKAIGWSTLEIRYGGMQQRALTAAERIKKYLNGEIDRLEELKEPRLDFRYTGFMPYRLSSSAL